MDISCWNGQGTTMGNEWFQNLEKIRSHFDTLLKGIVTDFPQTSHQLTRGLFLG
jgi:hypothetical protein